MLTKLGQRGYSVGEAPTEYIADGIEKDRVSGSESGSESKRGG